MTWLEAQLERVLAWTEGNVPTAVVAAGVVVVRPVRGGIVVRIGAERAAIAELGAYEEILDFA
jgi:hypothetical protein